MTKYVQTKGELLEHLKNQIAFMKQSASSYDNGFEDEAKRLAVAIRILVYDTSKSRSLLSSLNKKNIKFYDSALTHNRVVSAHHRSVEGESTFTFGYDFTFAGLTIVKFSAEGARHIAPLDSASPMRNFSRKIPFDEWWNGMFVIKDKYDKTFTRKGLVINTVNTDGGAHVDPKLDESYAKLSRFNSLDWKVFRRDSEDDFSNSPVLPSIRQITHEVLKTLEDEFPELF